MQKYLTMMKQISAGMNAKTSAATANPADNKDDGEKLIKCMFSKSVSASIACKVSLFVSPLSHSLNSKKLEKKEGRILSTVRAKKNCVRRPSSSKSNSRRLKVALVAVPTSSVASSRTSHVRT